MCGNCEAFYTDLRVVEVVRSHNLRRRSGIIQSTFCFRYSHLEHIAQDHIQVGFEYLQKRRLHNLSGQLVPVLCHPDSKELLICVCMELSMSQFVPIAPCSVAAHY